MAMRPPDPATAPATSPTPPGVDVKSAATVGRRGPDVVQLATEATLRAAQVRAASTKASEAIKAAAAKSGGST